ncbi:MAG: type II toxin-antitoxin system VapB family antitoxin [Gemmatimonadaceae bacterium]
MALNIKNRTTESLAQELARMTGTTLTEAVTIALRERLALVRHQQRPDRLLDEVRELQALVRNAPDRDVRSEDEILGYDEFGLPG